MNRVLGTFLTSVTVVGCGSDLAGLDPRLYAGTYILVAIDNQSLPTGVSTSWTTGRILSGRVDIDLDSNYWFHVRVEDSSRGLEDYLARGTAFADQTGRIEFVDRTGEVQWVGHLSRDTLMIEDFREMKATLQWRGPYRRPS